MLGWCGHPRYGPYTARNSQRGNPTPITGCATVRSTYKLRLWPAKRQEAALSACLENTRQALRCRV